MDLLRIAWRNMGRNKRRSVLTALAVAFAVTVLIFSMALQKGSYADMIHNTVRAHTGHLVIQHQGYWPRQELFRKLQGSDEILARLDPLVHIEGAAPRVNAAGLISHGNQTFPGIIYGIDPVREAGVSTLSQVIREGQYLDPNDLDGALIGETLARNLGVKQGGELVYLGQGADGSIAAGTLTVRGIFRTGMAEIDRATLAAHFLTIQEAFSMAGGVSEIAILLDRDANRSPVVTDIHQRLRDLNREDAAVLEWPTLLPGVEQSIQIDWVSGLIFYALIVLVVGFGIANTFLMAFLERIYEFGVLLALGMQPRLLSTVVYLESTMLSLAGTALGLLTGIGLVQYFHHHGLDFGSEAKEVMAQYGMDTIIHPQLTPAVLGWALSIVLTVTFFAGLYPAYKAARLNPMEALHR